MVETFRDRPYADGHFRQIVAYARNHNPFYREWISNPEDPPLLDRATALEHNDLILNGHPVTGTTSGSIGVPIRYSQSSQWHRRATRDFDRFVALLDHNKKAIREAFPNARMWETYSSMEFGMIAMMCPYEPGYFHIMAHRLGFEALRDDDSPVALGEPGRVFITDYFNRRSPLIRYELGDLVIRAECPCGRIRLPALSKILGRVSGSLLRRDGRRVLFVELSVALREIPGMRQYKVIQDGIEEFTVKVSARRNIDREIRSVFETHLGYLPERIQMEYVETIPRDPNGKYRTSICNV